MTDIPTMLTIKEVAKATGLAEHHVRQMCLNGEIAFVRTGRKILVNLDRLIDHLNAPPTPPAAPKVSGIRRIEACR